MRKLPTTLNTPAVATTRVAPIAAPPRSARWPGQELLDDETLAQVLFSVWSGDPAVVVPSPPGSGKTRLVTLLAAALSHRAGLRVAVAAQTRAQAAELGSRLAGLSDRCGVIAKKGAPMPGIGNCPTLTGSAVRWRYKTGGETLIATTARWLHAHTGSLSADVLIVDEAYQACYADIGAIGALAPQIVCVGDPGQIAPVVTGDTSRWAANPVGPHQPAPTALIAAHGDAVSVRRLRYSWRLGPQSCALVSGLFYPDLPFTSKRPDAVITEPGGHSPAEIVHNVVTATDGPTDRRLLRSVADRARELLDCTYSTEGVSRGLSASDVAVVVPHVAQASIVRAMLADVPDLTVQTANALQGIERPAVVALHPLAGYRELSSFATDPGRLCVALSRHKAHLSIVLDPRSVDMCEQGSAAATVLDAVLATDSYR